MNEYDRGRLDIGKREPKPELERRKRKGEIHKGLVQGSSRPG